MTVNTLRKQCHNDEVVSLAKALIKSWKKLLTGTVMLILLQVLKTRNCISSVTGLVPVQLPTLYESSHSIRKAMLAQCVLVVLFHCTADEDVCTYLY